MPGHFFFCRFQVLCIGWHQELCQGYQYPGQQKWYPYLPAGGSKRPEYARKEEKWENIFDKAETHGWFFKYKGKKVKGGRQKVKGKADHNG
ncbi:hypothetical protein D9M70_538460 [compost metagenome]